VGDRQNIAHGLSVSSDKETQETVGRVVHGFLSFSVHSALFLLTTQTQLL
jgi:hypothetical protein